MGAATVGLLADLDELRPVLVHVLLEVGRGSVPQFPKGFLILSNLVFGGVAEYLRDILICYQLWFPESAHIDRYWSTSA